MSNFVKFGFLFVGLVIFLVSVILSVIVSLRSDENSHELTTTMFYKKRTITMATTDIVTETEEPCQFRNLLRIGDGHCDDELNSEECNFDAGDCCLPIVEATFCYACYCYADNIYSPVTIKPHYKEYNVYGNSLISNY